MTSDLPNMPYPDLVNKYLGLDSDCDEQMIALQIEHMNACKEVSNRRKNNFKSAVASGMPKEGWRLQLKIDRTKRKAARQIANLLEDEEADTRESAELIREALGTQIEDLPLGKWAINQGAPSGNVVTMTPKAAGRQSGKKGPTKKGAEPDMSAESKAAAGDVADGEEPDLRSTRQREQEATRQEEAKARLAGIKPLKDDDKSGVVH